MRNTGLIPAIIMLIAGAITAIMSFLNGISISKMLTTLLVVLIVFYLIGFCVKKLFEKYLVVTKEDLAENGESEEGEDAAGEESQEAFEGTEDENVE